MKKDVDHLRSLRRDWKDEIPAQIIHSDSPDNTYKARYGWWLGVKSDVEVLLDDGSLTDPRKILAAREFLKFLEECSTPDFVHNNRVTSEHIEKANSFLDCILAE